jgi:GT2 family glycosyltransferase
MKISVIIPTCNRVADLERCLERLLPQVANLDGCEVIVTDDGDVESTRAQLAGKLPAVVWTQGPRRGPAANRNHGAELGCGKWLVFLDDDCVPTEHFLRSYSEAIDMEDDSELLFLEGATSHEEPPSSLLWEAPHNPCGDLLISCNFGISRTSYEVSGRFDERFPFACFEDSEFAARFMAKGGRTKFLPNAKVIHPLRRRPSSIKLARMWEGRVIYARDQGASGFRILWNLPWHVFRVIQSRFRNEKWTIDNFLAMCLFAREWLIVLYLTPGWVAKWTRLPRSKFWADFVSQHGPVAKYGF